MLLKKSSKKVHQGFKRKNLTVLGSFAEVKQKIGQGTLAGSSRMAGVSSANSQKQ